MDEGQALEREFCGALRRAERWLKNVYSSLVLSLSFLGDLIVRTVHEMPVT